MPLEPGKPCTDGEEENPESTCHNRQDASETENQQTQLRRSTEIPHSGDSLPSVSPNLVSVEELIEAEKGVCNMALAHEIVVDESFVIKQRDLPESSFEKTLEDIMKKAFWDSLRAQLNEDPPVYDHAIKLLGEIKESLLSFLLPGHTRLRNQINEVLDLELIKQEAENGALHIPKLADFIIGMMGTLCAPIRDDDIKIIRDITDVVELFREIFAVLDLMKLDMVNFAISSIRPHLMKQSVDYERKSFQEFFDKQHGSLDITTEWLQEAASELLSSDTDVSVHGGAAADAKDISTLCPTSVLNHAYVKLLKWDHTNRLFPEPVLMDQSRFKEMQRELNQLTVTAAVLLVIYNMTGAAISGLLGFLDRLKRVIKVLLTGMHTLSFHLAEAMVSMSEQICVEVNNCLSQHGFSLLTTEKETVLKGQIQAISSSDNSVRKLIDVRIQTFLKMHLTSSNPKSVAVPGGLGPVRSELEEITIKFLHLVNYNKLVFNPYYDTILTKVLKKNGSQLPGLNEEEQLSSR
ncbi:T-complex protein 11-like protein 1 isoform X1 [Carcharodon carcharias]|uniref:T-complex protein 11-like protein 1 isoform X1 n=1 Tax=Carcharodon carcharias TaxID=13397 RepID=UPI001B7F73FB|nr:T-complex protein 11-like protein 1 isoform X1 [Carcharodon carcharias]XP_041054165.1 T-complex protein 11-like protein 1 isoform X1 [Carcharodon carcharias]XP_041054167.1 T-complex protein 11-like protein 1 isoform X1 [Carcharodon carcharias]XP_041054168.1 T-complex protein 11-like protein 1 isoform X1 [Carcharodon carcharias]XP_041054169.1 T-complex protein 11-like protein 1 isoform X1 [Carcharodon carcharias]XP_041054170.1 T-complex protein 11-like protein 1 isoform X1 [Carcharodon carch